MAWSADLLRLRVQLQSLLDAAPIAYTWTVLLEFPIPRKGKRIDVVILTAATIILLEQKSGRPTKDDCLQAEEYALLLHYFHRPSNLRKIVTFVVSPDAITEAPDRQHELAFADSAAFWISPIVRVRWDDLVTSLVAFASEEVPATPIDAAEWDAGEYFPVPGIIEAARSLQSGLAIREIAHSRAARHDIDGLTAYIKDCVQQARIESAFVICFVTGVPGSGKSLVGLNLAFSSRADGETMNFMSGNGPLVKVFQSLFTGFEQRVNGFRAIEARTRAHTFIEDVHLFAKTYTQTTPAGVPSNHVVIFDEAQRAWNREQSFRKFKREYSEPEMFLRIMERHTDWAVIIALVGGGQEINDGEAGLGEWGRALRKSARPWRVHASPDAVRGGDSVAGSRLLEDSNVSSFHLDEDERLHLTVSVRSLKAENYSRWVNCVVEGDYKTAASLKIAREFPVYMTRSLRELRQYLRNQTLGLSRCGLVGSSKASRLRAEGLEPDSSFHADYDWDKWYLAPSTDVRSSSQLEVYATEFEIQGLELDWIGLCWGGDFIWSASQHRWLTRKFHNATSSGWSMIRGVTTQNFRRNSYRVLLTRARQGIIIYMPTGDLDDLTRKPSEFDETAAYLIACGVEHIPRVAREPTNEIMPQVGVESWPC